MGLPGSLRTFALLWLLAAGCRIVEGEDVDANTLARIIQFFNNNYKEVNEKGEVRQYAAAINVPKEQCQSGFVPDQNNFLTNEDARNVKNKIYDLNVALYESEELIAAGVLERNVEGKKYNRHSESILMKPPESSPMTNLLNKKDDGCVVFFTYNSPCVDTCIDVGGKYNILKMLEVWSQQKGLKAFVFNDIWKFDTKKDLKERFKAITKYVPLYRCNSAQQCYNCGQGDSISDNCVTG